MNPRRRHNTLRLTTALVMMACCAVVFSSFVISENLNKAMRTWGEDIQLVVYLSEEATDAEVQAVEAHLTKSEFVHKVELVTQEKALQGFREQLATYAPDLAKDEELLRLIPASFQAQLKEDIPGNQKTQVLEKLSAQAKQMSGVEEASFGQDWIHKYAAILTAIEWSSWVLGLVISLASMLVISNSIRSLVHARRDEIEILEMIGATPFMIRKPFVIEGALTGFSCSVAAVLLVGGVYQSVKGMIGSQELLASLSGNLVFPSSLAVILFILLFTSMGALGSWLSIRQVNSGWAAKTI